MTPSERSQSRPPWKRAAFAGHQGSETKLADQAAAVPARRERGDHDELAIAALAAGVAEGVGFCVGGGVVVLDAAIMAGADEIAGGSQRLLRRSGCRLPTRPLRASAIATASMAG